MLTYILILLICFFIFTTYLLHEKIKDHIEEIDKLNITLLKTSRELYRCQEKLKEKN